MPPVQKSCFKMGDGSISHRRRRRRQARMKEKLHELRAMVPNLTKVDKASILRGATLYAVELQMRAKMLRAQMDSSSEVSVVGKPEKPPYDPTTKELIRPQVDSNPTISKKIAKLEVVQVGERGVVKLVCNKGHGVAVSLYEALESFTSWDVESSILHTVAESFELNFTLNVGKKEVKMENLKQRVAGAFLKQGFDFIVSPKP